MRTIKLGDQYARAGEGIRGPRRIIGLELRICPTPNGDGTPQEEVFMTGLDIEMPESWINAPGHDWSVTLHTTNGDVTMDTRNGQYQSVIRN